MIIAITGGNGFIGSHIAKMIDEMGHTVIFISRDAKNAKNSFSYEDFFLCKIKTNIDFFIHMGSPNYDYAKDNSLTDGISNLTSKISLSLKNYNCKKIIYFSSAKIYGEPSLKIHNRFHEDSTPNPITDYGKEKLKAEKKIISNAKISDLNYLIYRMPMVYGKNSNSNIKKLLKFIEISYPFILFKNTNHLKKSLLSIENIKLYIKHNIENPDTINNNILNITDKDSLSLNELITYYKSHTNSKSFIIHLPHRLLTILVKFPLLSNYLLKIYGQFDIANNKIKSEYNIECIDTYNSITLMKHNE